MNRPECVSAHAEFEESIAGSEHWDREDYDCWTGRSYTVRRHIPERYDAFVRAILAKIRRDEIANGDEE